MKKDYIYMYIKEKFHMIMYGNNSFQNIKCEVPTM